MIRQNNTELHRWNFSRFGGVTQVLLKSADDIMHLRELDLKLWTVLAMPTQGIFLDPQTIALLDSNSDGFIRPPEVLEAADWIASQLSDLSLLMEEGDSVPLDLIKDDNIRSNARRLLDHIQRKEADSISAADITTQKNFLDAHALKYGASAITADSDEEKMKQLITVTVASDTMDGEIRERILKNITDAAHTVLAWQDSLQETKVIPFDLEDTQKAADALSRIKEKIEDYFLRCKLFEYAPEKAAALYADQTVLQRFSAENIHGDDSSLLSLPIAIAAANQPLPLEKAVNPAWKAPLQTFIETAIIPLIGKKAQITEEEFHFIVQKFTPYQECQNKKPLSQAALLSVPYLQALVSGEKQEEISALIEEALMIEQGRRSLPSLEKLVLLRRDFVTLLKNYISFSNFYEGKGSVFQAGALYFDSRAADLCFELNSDARHAALDTLSGAYLVYCDISRKESENKKIVALFTNGDGDSIVVGRNGIFFDRAGKDWNAVITKITANPISVRQAFFTPYKQLVSMIETQIATRASAGEAKSAELLSQTAAAVTAADKKTGATAPQGALPAAASKKLDLGTLALFGTALGGISALIGSILQALFGLGFWVPLGLIGIILCISGPSMILASIKLRKRSIAPILEANGWAVNIRTRINIPFGGQLTQLASIPFGSIIIPIDPFADKKNGRKIIIGFLCILLIAGAVFLYTLKFGWHFPPQLK